MKRLGSNALLVALFIVLMITSSCGFKDLDKRFFVLGIGVDLSDNPEKPYRVTLKLGIASPRIEPGETNNFQMISQDAGTITEAVRLLKSKVDKELDFGHAKVIIFGKSLATQDIQTPLDWFLRRRDIQKIASVAIGDPSAKEVLSIKVISERLPGNSLFLSFDNEGTDSSYLMTENLSDLHRRMTERGKDGYLPVIQPINQSYNINHIALLDKQKAKVFLSPDHTRIVNELVRGFSNIDIHTIQENNSFNIAVNQLKVKYAISGVSAGTPAIQMNLTLNGMVEESRRPIYTEDWSSLQKVAGLEVKERVEKVLQLMQKNGLDPIGFGLRYRAMGHISDQDWEQWTALYPSIPMNVNVQLKILGSGVIK
ncbi:Ger(x)C family spore germination protein [Bacillus sp. 3255]|uniref:Ger(x)C family spore germination protein n=1 Tax=Bacillus sp. 3255 TaxID=2817904 RepID=UPI00285D7935|nr:Ger(x)C family spore germination protein [Bacillus sp. 3255]MDR6879344.1 spore germination protein KC [Bacillus sp. 3255]